MYQGGEGEASVEQAQHVEHAQLVHLSPLDACRSGLAAAGIPRNLAAQNCPDGFIVAAIDRLLTQECARNYGMYPPPHGIQGFFDLDAFRQTLRDPLTNAKRDLLMLKETY